MMWTDDAYRKLVKRHSELNNFKISDTDRYVTIDYDGRKLSINHLAWLQIMGLIETWDIL